MTNSSTNKSIPAAIIFFLIASLFYPMVIFKVRMHWDLTAVISLMTVGTASMLAAGIILFRFRQYAGRLGSTLIPAILSAPVLIVCFWHFFSDKNSTVEDLFQSLSYVVIPLFVILNRRGVMKCLPAYVSILWVINLANMIMDDMGGRGLPFGISGNINWNAAFLIVSTMFLVHTLHESLKNRMSRPSLWLICLIPVAVSVFYLVRCDSRSAYLTLAALAGLHLLTTCPEKMKRGALVTAIFAGLLLGLMFFRSDKAAEIMARDVRIPLWQGALTLISENPWVGVGTRGFEAKYAQCCPVEYFFRQDVAVRHDHPHNEFLYFAACNGVLAFIGWGILLLYPVIYGFLEYRRERRAVVKLSLFALTALVIHSMFDLVLFMWPTNILALIFLGILWSKAWPLREGPGLEAKDFRVLVPFMKLAGLALFLAALAIVCQTFKNTYYLRAAMLADARKYPADIAAGHFKESVCAKPTTVSLYRAAMHANSTLKNRDLSMEYLLTLKDLHGSFAHSNAFLGSFHSKRKEPHAALDYYIAEAKNFPLSTLAWYHLAQTYLRLGRMKEFNDADAKLKLTLEAKGLGIKDLKTLIENPDFDLLPHKIYSNSLREGGSN